MATTKIAKLEPVDLKLEVVVLGVSDVDRAKAFYVNLGWRLDADFSNGTDFRIIQVTPPRSPAARPSDRAGRGCNGRRYARGGSRRKNGGDGRRFTATD